MDAWVSCFGKPLLCVIECERATVAYRYDIAATDAVALPACELVDGQTVLVHDPYQQGVNHVTSVFFMKRLFAGQRMFRRLGQPLVTVCGAGALGSQLADNLARQGVRQLRVIDFDRVEEHNVGTQLYGVADVGAKKVDVLRSQLFRATENGVGCGRQAARGRQRQKAAAR